MKQLEHMVEARSLAHLFFPAKQPHSGSSLEHRITSIACTHSTHFSGSNSAEMENRHLSLLEPIAMVINESKTPSLCCWKILMHFPLVCVDRALHREEGGDK